MSYAPYRLNSAILAVQAPPIPEAQAWAREYSGEFGPLIDLSQAVPGTPPPPEMLDCLARAAASPEATRYGPILGDADVRAAFAAEASRNYAAPIGADAIVITAGANQAFVVTMLALAKPGDRVLLPTPFYFNHKMSLDMLGIGAALLPCEAASGFVPDPDAAERLIDPSTRAIVLVSPNNPTGAAYPPAIIARFAALARKYGLALVLDATYRDFLDPALGPPHTLFSDPDWGDCLIELYSFSKSYAIPGHRLGAIIAAPATIAQIGKIQDNVQICPARAGQRALLWAIEGLRDWRAAQRAELARREAACRAAFAAAPGWRLFAAGAYFAYIGHPFTGANSREAAQRLVREAGILGLPGAYFGPGQEGALRLAFANVDGAALGLLAARLGG